MAKQSKSDEGMDRRRFLILSGVAAGAAGLAALGIPSIARAEEQIKLPSLPWAENALEPYISAKTISFHYGKHHAGYVEKINTLSQGTPFADMPLEERIRQSAGKPDQSGVFNNAAQVWNHTFYWNSMKPGGGGEPAGELADKIKADFGDYGSFREAFAKAAGSQFGSGWGWLVLKDGKLEIMNTGNADTPIAHGLKPLLTIDVWEHAYYLDYQNKRGDYIQAYLEHLVNWDFASQNLKA